VHLKIQIALTREKNGSKQGLDILTTRQFNKKTIENNLPDRKKSIAIQ